MPDWEWNGILMCKKKTRQSKESVIVAWQWKKAKQCADCSVFTGKDILVKGGRKGYATVALVMR